MVQGHARNLTPNYKTLIADFTFHNVGQGLFYTGKIGDFNFIYDCGSERRKHLNFVVKDYVKQRLASLRVDLLILSHLHDDHVSGLNALFGNGISIDTVILPYLPPIERLMIALRNVNMPQWFYDFWADPVTFLIEKGVDRVILIGGREGRYPERPLRDEKRFEGEEKKLDLSEMFEDRDLRKEVVEKDSQLHRFLGQRKLLTMSHEGHLKAMGIWIFRFFNYKAVDSKVKSFEKCVKPAIQNDDLIAAIRSRSQLIQLKNCYNILQGEFNGTSLVVYHAPIKPDRLKITALVFNYHPNISPICLIRFPYNFNTREHGAIGHFLTGDINLNKKWTEIEKHYDPYFSKVTLVLVPHHGAKKNWSKAILTKIAQPCSWIVSAGISNKYGHPSFNVIQELIRKGDIPYISNEINEISIKSIA